MLIRRSGHGRKLRKDVPCRCLWSTCYLADSGRVISPSRLHKPVNEGRWFLWVLGIREQFGFLDSQELARVGELLQYLVGFRNWEERIGLFPDTVDFCVDLSVNLREPLVLVPVYGFQEAKATSQFLRIFDQRFRCERKELAMDKIFVGKTSAEAHGAPRQNFCGNAELEEVTRKG